MARILIIDDSAVMRNLLAEFFAELGHETLTADNGITGVQTASTEEIDICICDIHMPGKNGPEVYKDISSQNPQIHFIFTDSMPDHISDKVTGLAPASYLRKPFELVQIRNLVQSALKPDEKE